VRSGLPFLFFSFAPASALDLVKRACRAALCRYQAIGSAAGDMRMPALQLEKSRHEESTGTALAGVCRMPSQREHRCRDWNPRNSIEDSPVV